MDRTPEELAEVQRAHDVLLKAMDREIWQIAELMVGKRDDQLFGETEFALRDKVLRMDYPEYRKQGLPMTSTYVESTVKQINRRMRGTEKFWSHGVESMRTLVADHLSCDLR